MREQYKMLEINQQAIFSIFFIDIYQSMNVYTSL